MRKLVSAISLSVICLCFCGLVLSQDINGTRAKYNYQMSCQGCHTPDGSGFRSVPEMKGNVGNFLRTAAGREYLVRVPGSATSALTNPELAEVLNWILVEFSGDSLSDTYRPYTAEEVGELRKHPLNEVEQYRAQLLGDIAAANMGNSYSKTTIE